MRALVSVSDKEGLADFISEVREALARHNLTLEILSTGGTAKALRGAGFEVVDVAEYTGSPEILDGRVKTLHPKIHAGLLARDIEAHLRQIGEQHIALINMVVVNLYPFQRTVARPECTLEDAIENIDIGGPSMLRSAAKNHERVTVVCDPQDYATVLEELRWHGATTRDTRMALAAKVFAITSAYDKAIADYLRRRHDASQHR